MVNTDYDSILTAQDTNFINTSEYYKVGKELPDHGIPVAERPYSVAKDDYVVGGLFLILLVVGLMLYRNRATLAARVKDFFVTRRTYSRANVNENDKEIYSTFVMLTVSALSLSGVVFNSVSVKYGFERALGVPYWLFAVGYVFFMAFIYIKAWAYALVNWTFFDRESSAKWMSGYMLLTSLTSFAFFPLSLVAVLVPGSFEIVIWCFIFIAITYELLLLFKMFANFGGKKYGYLLIFLYFCSVELMSAVVMSRIIQWAIDYFIVKLLY